MELSKLLEREEYTTNHTLKGIEIKKLTANVNEITKNTLFVLVKGINFDTGKIIEYVLQKHPAALICDNDRKINAKIPVIFVENARKTLAILCSKFNKIDYRKTRFVAVTGTNGKTTTATILKSIFEKSGIKTGFIGTGKIAIGEKIINKKNLTKEL